MAVCKINIDSDLRLAMTAGVRQQLIADPAGFDPQGLPEGGPPVCEGPGERQDPPRPGQRQQGMRALVLSPAIHNRYSLSLYRFL